jgi:FkbM family methyltransferase
MDIGAADPARLSNTFLFYSRGASGVLIEPDPDQADQLRAKRPRDTVVTAAVAFNGCSSLTLTKMSNPLFNSLSRERCLQVVEQSKFWSPRERQQIVGTVAVQLIAANCLLESYFGEGSPHFLSIDAEGADFEILKSIDFHRFRPQVICIEAQAPIDDHLQVLGSAYRLIFQSPDNFMFARI